MVSLEQILNRNLPAGTKAALRVRAKMHNQSVEAELREIIAAAIGERQSSLVNLLSVDEGFDIEFEPGRIGLPARTAEL